MTQNYATNTSGAPATNRVIGDSTGAAFGYDQAGNMTSAPGWTYAYDGANRLNQASGPSGTSTYAFDGDGMRVKQTPNGGSPLLYVRSSVLKQTVLEVNSTQGVYRAYIYAGGKLLAERTPDGNLYWLHTNHLGNSSRMTDQNGTMVYRGEFDPYGNLVYEWGSAGFNTRKFTGYERDSNTGLDYANARMYGPGRGRFMQPDPAGLKGANRNNPASLNRYSYVNNDPVNSIDPSGNFLANPWCQQIYIDNIYVGNTCGGGWGGFFDLPYPEFSGPAEPLPEPIGDICNVEVWARPINYPEGTESINPYFHMFVTLRLLGGSEDNIWLYSAGPENNIIKSWKSQGNASVERTEDWIRASANSRVQVFGINLPGNCSGMVESFDRTMDAVNAKNIPYNIEIISYIPLNIDSAKTNNSNTFVYTLLQNWSPQNRLLLERGLFINGFSNIRTPGYGHSLPL